MILERMAGDIPAEGVRFPELLDFGKILSLLDKFFDAFESFLATGYHRADPSGLACFGKDSLVPDS